MYVCVCVYIYIYIHTHTHIHTCKYARTHTHTQDDNRKSARSCQGAALTYPQIGFTLAKPITDSYSSSAQTQASQIQTQTQNLHMSDSDSGSARSPYSLLPGMHTISRPGKFWNKRVCVCACMCVCMCVCMYAGNSGIKGYVCMRACVRAGFVLCTDIGSM